MQTDTIIEATCKSFKNKDYNGYVTYTLKVFSSKKFPIIIRRLDDGKGFCPYSHISKFLEEWCDISSVTPANVQ